jgi:hypothetical protein
MLWRITERTTLQGDEASQKLAQIRQQLFAQKQDKIYSEWFSTQRDQADISDSRPLFWR